MLYNVLYNCYTKCYTKCYTGGFMMRELKQFNFRLPIDIIARIDRITDKKTEFVISALEDAIHAYIQPLQEKDIPDDIQPHIQTKDMYIQPYINQLKDTITRLECDKSKLEEDKNNLWQEISQLHLNHMKVMDKIILLPPRKEEEFPKEMPKKKGFGFVRM